MPCSVSQSVPHGGQIHPEVRAEDSVGAAQEVTLWGTEQGTRERCVGIGRGQAGTPA